MISETPEIKLLREAVEEKYACPLKTTTDFEELSGKISLVLNNVTVSASTLKRMWSYVNDSHKTRTHTLNILSRYVGYENFKTFVKEMKSSIKFNSSFFSADQVVSSELETGTELMIGWAPDRLLRLRYLGDSLYEVLEAANSKLMAGDRFMTGSLLKEYPLYLPYIIRNGVKTPPFVGGRNGGLSCLNILSK